MKKYSNKNIILFTFFSFVLGFSGGIIVNLFIKLLNIGIDFIWNEELVKIPFYTIIVCTLGGLLIGIWRKFFGNYPEELEEVVGEIKKTGGYKGKNIFVLCVSAMMPLLIGGSVGPEAGLTGIISAICTKIGEKIKSLFREMKTLTKIGVTATLGMIFHSPIFGLAMEVEEENKLPKKEKLVTYFLAIFGAFVGFWLINQLFNSHGMSFKTIGEPNISFIECLYLIPLSFIGLLLGLIFNYSKKA